MSQFSLVKGIQCKLNKKRLGNFWTKFGNPDHSGIGKAQTPSVFVLTKNPNGRYMVIRGAICVSPTAYYQSLINQHLCIHYLIDLTYETGMEGFVTKAGVFYNVANGSSFITSKTSSKS